MDTSSLRLDRIEFVATILLGLAAVAIGWSTYQAALWGGLQDEGYTESIREANNAVDLLQAADTIRTVDQILFAELITSGVCSEDGGGDDVACDQVLANMSDGGVAAVEEWLAGNEQAPFESSTYTESLYQQGETAKAVSEDFFVEAGEANGNGDNYELASTILTVVMFFAGVAVVLDEGRIAWALLGGAALMLVGASGYVLSLPPA